MTSLTPTWAASPWLRGSIRAPRTVFEALFFVLLPLVAPAMVVAYLIGAYHPEPGWVDGTYFPDGGFLFDLHTMWKAGHEVVIGESPYPFIYPAPAVVMMAPFGAMPFTVAVVPFTLMLIAATVLALRLLGVSDWRCYAAALASVPVASSIMIGTLSPLLLLAAAAAWRYRDRRFVVATAIASVVVTKIFLWPLAIWLIATRRFKSAATTILLGIAIFFGAWGILGFSGLRDYPSWLGRAAGMYEARSYSPLALFRSLGLSTGSARLLVLALAAAGLAAIFLVARREDGDRRSFLVAIGVSLLVSPIVWLHYLVLLYVPVALYRSRLSAAWLVPLAYWFLPGQESHGSAGNFARMLALTLVTLAFAFWPRRERSSAPALSTP
jgi:hypothetical protein